MDAAIESQEVDTQRSAGDVYAGWPDDILELYNESNVA